MRVSNCKASNYTRDRIPFTGNNLFAVKLLKGYVIYSYGHHWPLFVYHNRYKKWYGNDDKYSVTTSKHKSQCGIIDYTPCTIERMQEIIESLS